MSTAPLTVLEFGADPTGVADSSAAIRLAMAAAVLTPSKLLLVPCGTYVTNDGAVITVPASLTVQGVGMPTIQAHVNVGWTLSDFCTLRGLCFDTYNTGVTSVKMVYIPTGAEHCLIELNKFYGGVGCVGVQSELQAFDCVIRDNYFNHGNNGVALRGAIRFVVTDNQFYQMVRSIYVSGSTGGIFTNNEVLYGITGIGFFSDRAGVGASNVCIGNTIMNNSVSNVSEEGITFDCIGNDNTKWPENGTKPIVTYASLGPTTSTLQQINISETGMAAGWANSYWAIPIQGNNVGLPFFISSSNSGYITVERSNGDGAAWTIGDKFVITTPFMSNIVKGNTCTNCGLAGISFWGSNWHNIIEGNTLTFNGSIGIQMTSVVNALIVASGFGVQAWSGFNIIKTNTIQNIEIGGAAAGNSYPIMLYTDITGIPIATAIKTPGCQILNNVIASSRNCYIHDLTRCLIDDNSMLGSAVFDITNTDRVIYGRNYKIGLLDDHSAMAVTAGTTTNFKKLIVAAQVDSVAADLPTMVIDFNTWLANARAAQLLEP